MHGEIYQTLEAVAAQAACAVPSTVALNVKCKCSYANPKEHHMPAIQEHRQGSQLSTAAASAALHNSPASSSQGLVPIWSSESARTQTNFRTLHRGELPKFAFSGLRCCIFLFFSILHFVTAPFTNASFWRKHPEQWSPVQSLTEFLVQLRRQSSQTSKHNKAGKKR